MGNFPSLDGRAVIILFLISFLPHLLGEAGGVIWGHPYWFFFEEAVKGSLVPGKLADLVVLSGDPTGVSPEEIRDLQVEMTMVGGKIVWRRGL